jgi:hypothetical protein
MGNAILDGRIRKAEKIPVKSEKGHGEVGKKLFGDLQTILWNSMHA